MMGVVLILVALVAVPASAHAQRDALVPESVAPPTQATPPPGFGISARQAEAVAGRLEAVRQARADHPGLKAMVAIPSTADEPSFEVMFATPGVESQYGSDIRVEVIVSGSAGRCSTAGPAREAATSPARGEEPSVERALNRPYIWLPLAATFLLTFCDPRRPL
jgi:hypothetical protein